MPWADKERKRAYKRSPERLAGRLELDQSGVAAILADVRSGRRYIDIAADWLIHEADVSDLAIAHGISRRRRRTSAAGAAADGGRP